MTKGNEHGRKIAEAMLELQHQFRANLNSHNDIYAEYMAEGVYPDSAAAQLAEDEDFIEEYLHDEMMALAKSVLLADWYGLYCAGYVPAAASYDEYRQKEAKQTKEFYNDINKTITDFKNKMDEWKQGII